MNSLVGKLLPPTVLLSWRRQKVSSRESKRIWVRCMHTQGMVARPMGPSTRVARRERTVTAMGSVLVLATRIMALRMASPAKSSKLQYNLLLQSLAGDASKQDTTVLVIQALTNMNALEDSCI